MGLLDDMDGEGNVSEDKRLKSHIRTDQKAALEAIMSAYEEWLPRTCKEKEAIADLEINPQLIETFCKKIPVHKDHNLFIFSGMFLSAIIQRAYDKGMNNPKCNNKNNNR
jgi:hypothetical protein